MSEREPWMPDVGQIDRAAETYLPAHCVAAIRALIRAAVSKALAEQGCTRGQNTTQFCAEAVDLQRKLDEQEARHKREVIEARINEAREYLFLCDSDSGWQRLATIEAELAALDKEAGGE